MKFGTLVAIASVIAVTEAKEMKLKPLEFNESKLGTKTISNKK